MPRSTRPSEPPARRGHWLLGCLPDYRRDALGLFLNTARDYGDVARLRFPGGGLLTLNGPDAIRHVLQDNAANYVKGRGLQATRGLLGNGLLNSEGDFWRRQRRLAAPAFHHQRIATLNDVMVRCATETLAAWDARPDPAAPVDMHAEMLRLGLRIAGLTMFGADLGDRADAVGHAIKVSSEYSLFLATTPPFVANLPTRRAQEVREAAYMLDGIVYSLIRARRKEEGGHRADLLSLYLEARDEDTGERMDETQVRDEVMTLLLAGHETSAATMSWTWALLSENPEPARRLRAELAEVLGGRAPTFADIPRLPYTARVIQESLRMRPPAWFISRASVGPDEINGYRIPPHQGIGMLPWVMHRDPRFWDDPDAFDPDRFLPARSEGRPRYAYFPFGGGPRACIGQAFAETEAILLLATLAQRYAPQLAPCFQPTLQPLITLRPKHGVLMTLKPA